MTDQADRDSSAIGLSFGKALNSHGYNFQYTVLRAARDAAGPRGSPWGLLVHEFPVRVQGSDTRIDFVLENHRKPLLMVAECKRANPALADWCFARVPADLVRPRMSDMFVEAVKEEPQAQSLRAHPCTLFPSDRIYHIALELKTREKGDASMPGRGAIEDAATQVCRGTSGLLAFLAVNLPILRQARGPGEVLGLLPVIFTTARLWVSAVDISSAQLDSGVLDESAVPVSEEKWLYYLYHQSPGLMHSLPSVRYGESLADALRSRYVRPIAIVNAMAIAEFLSLDAWRY